MTNQAHLFGIRFGARTDESAAPGTDDLEPNWKSTIGFVITMTNSFLAQIFPSVLECGDVSPLSYSHFTNSLKLLSSDDKSGDRSPHSKIQTNFVPVGDH